MSSDLNELYQQLILEHNKTPRNFKKLEHATHHAEGYNPLCGDHYTVYLKIDGDKITDVGFQGNGCAISKSSASMMTTAIKGGTIEHAKNLFSKFHTMVTRDMRNNTHLEENIEELGCLGALSGVAEFPARIKCASLAWHALNAAINNHQVITTENEKTV